MGVKKAHGGPRDRKKVFLFCGASPFLWGEPIFVGEAPKGGGPERGRPQKGEAPKGGGPPKNKTNQKQNNRNENKTKRKKTFFFWASGQRRSM